MTGRAKPDHIKRTIVVGVMRFGFGLTTSIARLRNKPSGLDGVFDSAPRSISEFLIGACATLSPNLIMARTAVVQANPARRLFTTSARIGRAMPIRIYSPLPLIFTLTRRTVMSHTSWWINATAQTGRRLGLFSEASNFIADSLRGIHGPADMFITHTNDLIGGY